MPEGKKKKKYTVVDSFLPGGPSEKTFDVQRLIGEDRFNVVRDRLLELIILRSLDHGIIDEEDLRDVGLLTSFEILMDDA